ncbi:hypothetical protein MMC21_007247 [Puttea exsequens]|nr:hypothetical protein [Puttea exsequens]
MAYQQVPNHQAQAAPNAAFAPAQQPQHPQPLPGFATSPQPAYGQPVPQSRVLHVYHDGLTHRHSKVLDSDKQTVLYRIEVKLGAIITSKPQVEIFSAISNNLVATLYFHKLSRGIDMTVHGQTTEIKKAGIMTTTCEFRSLAAQDTMRWKRDGVFSGGDLLCLDSKEQLLAKFENSSFALKKEGKIELGPGVGGVLMDEIVTSGIAMIEQQRRRRNSSSAGGGS